jgi:hypothetical protein
MKYEYNKMEQERERLQLEIEELEERIRSNKLKIKSLLSMEYEYSSWLYHEGHKEKGLGYFNCLPTEIIMILVSFLPKSYLPSTCKQLTFLLKEEFKRITRNRVGDAVTFFEVWYPNDYNMWYKIIKGHTNYYTGNGFVISLREHHKFDYQIFNYTDRYWYFYSDNIYINSLNTVCKYEKDSCTIYTPERSFYFNHCVVFTANNGNKMLIPTGRLRAQFISLFETDIIYKEHREQIKEYLSVIRGM